jgi:hypothetical protein
MLHSVNKSIRVGKKIYRVTLNPAIYARSLHVVDWKGKNPELADPHELVESAQLRYPTLSFSAAVEACIVDLLIEEAARRGYLSGDEWEQARRYLKLKPFQKIRSPKKKKKSR